MQDKNCGLSLAVFKEAVRLMQVQYGHINVRTERDRPSLCTVLISYCKADLKGLILTCWETSMATTIWDDQAR